MNGIQNFIGIGAAQITPDSGVDPMQVAQQINQNIERKNYLEQQKKEQEQRRQASVVGLVGKALDPKIFDKVFQEKVIDAQQKVFKKLQENPNLSEADVAIMAGEEAQRIAQIDGLFKQGQAQIAASTEKYAKDENIDKAGIEAIQRKILLDKLDKHEAGDQNVDFTADTFEEARKLHPFRGLRNDNKLIEVKLDRGQEYMPLKGDFSDKEGNGALVAKKWEVDIPHPFYNVTNLEANGTVKAGETPKWELKQKPAYGLLEEDGETPMMMIDDNAYERIRLNPKNDIVLENIVLDKYKDKIDFDANPEMMDVLKRVEALQEVKKQFPVALKTNSEKTADAPIKVYNTSRVYNNGNKTSPKKIDLREYPKSGGDYNITSLMQGINVVSMATGKAFAATDIKFNPSTKRVTFTDPVSKKTETMGLTTFLQNIKPQNSQADVTWLREGLENPITDNEQPASPNNPKPKEKPKSSSKPSWAN